MTADNSVNVRAVAADAVLEILERGAYSHLLLRQVLAKYGYLSRQDRAFLTRLVQGTVERAIELDWMIGQYSSVPVKKLKPFIRSLLRISVYQLKYMRVPASAVCNEAVKLAKKRHFAGLTGFVNGVLRKISAELPNLPEQEDWSLRYSMPPWLLEQWRKQYPTEILQKMLEGFYEKSARGLCVRCNLSLASPEEVKALLEQEGVKAEADTELPQVLWLQNMGNIEKLSAFSRGWFVVQDKSSVLAGLAAAPKPGSFCVDVCAAPGGKTLHLADQMRGSGLVESRDVSEEKCALIRENVLRCGFENVHISCWDAREFDGSLAGQADVLLADLPCSGLGILGGKPDIKYRMNEEKQESLVLLQREILETIWQYVKPGGRMIYSTCTINRQENEEQAAWICGRFPFRLVRDRQYLPGVDGCDGFYIAELEREEI
ncbi:16S rRNA (cytosine(967)-C(5))-methyltransferase RsmB [Cuneatibacter caecimuris]|uniref:16S rRNA (cytosine(967)-C(5))-methyltransferase n=1 Tax=Cuneatibacter caecimuris TaxID=1796618 RepID=A0A4Q7PML4_9FIRM|nr:16S rRNA (cytosine(967)-C(5))-methyltransferase RsmB [Cuneatibacter caecimuris]RZT02152.1 16S rRNA (cytosine967-C5)-methyltransferase [Cuneatibacter caecimuris]